MAIYLMQHGQARPKEEDPERPLDEQGREDVQRVAARLVAAGAPVRRIVHSGKTRARQSAEEVARVLEAAGPPPAVETADDLGPTDDPGRWADRLTDAGRDGTLLVGHLPYMERLASRLVAGVEEHPVVRFRKGGVLCLGRDDEGGWTVRFFVTPVVA